MPNRFSHQSAGPSPSRLPQPDPAAIQQSARLSNLIQEEVLRAGGSITFDRYMELALYAPQLGYYTAGARKFGEGGDFITAPEISPVFGRCLARQCHQVLKQLGGGRVMEFGAGSGSLAAVILAELQALDCLPQRYLILEVSPDLKARQQELLSRLVPGLVDRVEWLEALPKAGFRGVVIANELIDAMPVQRFRIDVGVIMEQHVACDEGRLYLEWRQPSELLETGVRSLVEKSGFPLDDFESELNHRGALWVQALSRCLEAGLILLIDYGYGSQEYYHPQRNRGTLMCHFRHRAHTDPLFYPGLQDITTHVDFSALAVAARQSGLSICGYNTQAFFLMGCGLERLLAASDPDDVRAHMQLMQGVKRLTLPSEMGERFKVLGLSRNLGESPMGFALQDMRDRL